MSMETHIIITGICALLTTQGIPTKVVLPDGSAHQHKGWVLFQKDAVKDLADPRLKIPKLDDDDPMDTGGEAFRYVELADETVRVVNSTKEKMISVVDGRPADLENPTNNVQNTRLLHWVADLRRLVKKTKQELDDDPDLVGGMEITAGRISTGKVVKGCIWDFKPKPPAKYKQALAEEVELAFTAEQYNSADEVVIELKKFDESATHKIVLKPDANKRVWMWLGNTTEEDILPEGVDCDENETVDRHFSIYYDLLDDGVKDKPLPTKPDMVAASQVRKRFQATRSIMDLAVSPNRITPPMRGGGLNCPPLRAEGDIDFSEAE